MHSHIFCKQVFHKHGVICHNFKPDNFLFADEEEYSLLKAIEFGLSMSFRPGENYNSDLYLQERM